MTIMQGISTKTTPTTHKKTRRRFDSFPAVATKEPAAICRLHRGYYAMYDIGTAPLHITKHSARNNTRTTDETTINNELLQQTCAGKSTHNGSKPSPLLNPPPPQDTDEYPHHGCHIPRCADVLPVFKTPNPITSPPRSRFTSGTLHKKEKTLPVIKRTDTRALALALALAHTHTHAHMSK